MKRSVLMIILLSVFIKRLQAQSYFRIEDPELNTNTLLIPEFKEISSTEEYFIEGAFHSPVLINSQTAEVLHKNSFEFLFEQRFGRINTGFNEMYGFNISPNLRAGLAFGLTDRFTVSLGLITMHTLMDFGYKYTLLKQTSSDRIPFSVSFYGNTSTSFDKYQEFEKNSDRFSFFNQVIASRKLGNNFSFFMAPGFLYFNQVDTSKCEIHNSLLVAAGGKLNISHHTSLILEYGQGHLLTRDIYGKAMPGVSFGLETTTQEISFQVFATTFREISEQDNYMYNTNNYLKGDFLIGFNISYSWFTQKN